jgi:hypothetical protein
MFTDKKILSTAGGLINGSYSSQDGSWSFKQLKRSV